MTAAGWAVRVADATMDLACGRATHRLRWRRGRLAAVDHPDLAGEEALVAFGGEAPRCLEAVTMWRAAVTDGGFLAEWCEGELADPVRRHHLWVALNRLRNEGVQDLLRELPPARAEAMGTMVLTFPPELVDRAALAVVRRTRRVGPDDPVHRWTGRAVQVRARTAFVASLARWAPVVRPAALVRFRCEVVPWGTPPQVEGLLDGTASWCRVALDPSWLVEAWPSRGGLVGGDLCVGRGPRTALVVSWRPDGRGRLVAELTEAAGPGSDEGTDD